MTASFPIVARAGAPETQDAVELRLERIGPDFLLRISGGAEHVGALALFDGEPKWIKIEGHREGALAAEAARTLGPKLGGRLVVVAGIHYDSISREAIARIVGNVRKLAEEISRALG
ncbi:MAG: hypothetical protein J6Y56_07950 [Fibrobacterales bacterium]|nr:hypothetical protein [Fibrobacterales bacterium]